MVSPESRMLKRNFVRGLLAFGTLDQRDHSIEKGLAGVGGDFDLHPIRQHARAAGHRRAIAACLANDWSGFAGDRRFVDRCDALDDLAVAGDELAGFDSNDVAGAKLRAGDRFGRAVGAKSVGHGLALGLAQRVGLGLAAALGHGFGEVREEHGEPEPEGDLQIEAGTGLMLQQVLNK